MYQVMGMPMLRIKDLVIQAYSLTARKRLSSQVTCPRLAFQTRYYYKWKEEMARKRKTDQAGCVQAKRPYDCFVPTFESKETSSITAGYLSGRPSIVALYESIKITGDNESTFNMSIGEVAVTLSDLDESERTKSVVRVNTQVRPNHHTMKQGDVVASEAESSLREGLGHSPLDGMDVVGGGH